MTEEAREATLERVARAIMMARDDGGCIVTDWKAEARDNPHVAQAMRQAFAASRAILGYGWESTVIEKSTMIVVDGSPRLISSREIQPNPLNEEKER